MNIWGLFYMFGFIPMSFFISVAAVEFMEKRQAKGIKRQVVYHVNKYRNFKLIEKNLKRVA